MKAYHQVPVHPPDIPKTAVITPFGLYEYRYMPYGLCNAAQTFQRLMDNILHDLPFVFVYLDNILIASSSFSQHLRHLHQLLSLLAAKGILVNPTKCSFAQSSVDFLGHHVTAAGITPFSSHVQAILDYPQPTTVKDLQRLLGLINFYYRFVPRAAAILRPLTDALIGAPKFLSWTPSMTQAFQQAQQALSHSHATLLAYPLPKAPLSLATDASDSHIGSVLQQQISHHWQLALSFFSAKLSPTQQCYSTFDRELQAAYSAVFHFRSHLEGRPFLLFTDHKPLVAAFHRLSPPKSAVSSAN